MAKKHRGTQATVDKERTVQSGPAVLVEFPQDGEDITAPSYTFHIATAPEAGGVEVSIDRGEWMPCRESLGLWWYDWSGYENGEHELVARTRTGAGVYTVSAPRRFQVKL